MPTWATPEGWAHGIRPSASSKSNGTGNGGKVRDGGSKARALAKEIDRMAEALGRGLYRGLLRDLARVWTPEKIDHISLLEKVVEHMRSAEPGLSCLKTALDKLGPEAPHALSQAMRVHVNGPRRQSRKP